MKKVLSVEEVTIVNQITGELLGQESSVTTKTIEKEPEYIKLYVADLVRLSDIPKGMTSILLALLGGMSYGNIIPAFKPVKLIICEKLGISIDYLNKAIQVFYKKGIFVRAARGMYMADPELFGKGKWQDIKKLRLQIEYQADGTKKMTSSLSPNAHLAKGLATGDGARQKTIFEGIAEVEE